MHNVSIISGISIVNLKVRTCGLTVIVWLESICAIGSEVALSRLVQRVGEVQLTRALKDVCLVFVHPIGGKRNGVGEPLRGQRVRNL